MSVRKADCCGNCKNVFPMYHFRDAVQCSKDRETRYHTEVCDEFEMEVDKE